MTFEIPANISGSFSFDENPEDEDKLINIDASAEGWVLYSTSESKVLDGGKEVEYVPLKPNSYYIIKKNDKNYLIYVTPLFDNSFTVFNYTQDINLTIGNDPSCNVIFSNSLFNGVVASLFLASKKL